MTILKKKFEGELDLTNDEMFEEKALSNRATDHFSITYD